MAGDSIRFGALERFLACSARLDLDAEVEPETAEDSSMLLVWFAASILAVVTCKATPLMCAGAGEEVAERDCFKLDLRGMYDEGEGNSCKGAEVEGVFDEDMVPDQCQAAGRSR